MVLSQYKTSEGEMNTVPFPKHPRLALLDWDGTFCDSRESIYNINAVMAEFYGVSNVIPSFQEWLQASHPGVEAFMKALGVTEGREEINAYFHTLLEEQRTKGFQNPLYPGTQEFLSYLKDQGIPAVIISRHPHSHLEADIEAHGLSDFFCAVIGEPEDARLEKDVVMRYACDELLVSYRSAFYLGDTSHDMRLAHQAGVCAVAVSHGYDPASELLKENPARIFDSLPDFQNFLSG